MSCLHGNMPEMLAEAHRPESELLLRNTPFCSALSVQNSNLAIQPAVQSVSLVTRGKGGLALLFPPS